MAANYSPGDLLKDRYKLISLLGKGGFSVVWLVEDTYTSTRMAIKIYAPDKGLDKDGLAQFQKEYRRTRGLHHPNLLVPDHFDILNDNNSPFLSMRYCSNGSLSSNLMKNEFFDEMEIALLLSQVGSGLKYLHDRQVIHQDIKPDNILIDGNGNLLLTDFGISRQMRSTLNKATANQSYMTVAYSPPERYSANPVDTPASDIFSLGVMIYELCTGSLPWDGTGGMVWNTGAAVPNLPDRYSGRLNAIVKSCMNKDCDLRPSAGELEAIGKTFLEESFWREVQLADSKKKTEGGTSSRKTVKLDGEPPNGINNGRAKDKPGAIDTEPGKTGQGYMAANIAVSVVFLSLLFYVGLTSFGVEFFKDKGIADASSPDLANLASSSDLTNSTNLKSDSKSKDQKEDKTPERIIKKESPKITKPDPKPIKKSPAGLSDYNTAKTYHRSSNFGMAYTHFLKSADANYAPSLYFLGRMYHYGEGISENYGRALDFYNRAIQSGDDKGNYGLALLYLEGKGVPENENTARSYFSKSYPAVAKEAKTGHYFWQYALGYLHHNGYGTVKNERESYQWFKASADQGFAPAQYELGDLYYHGRGVTRDYVKAREFFLKSADQGYAAASSHLGDIYYNGHGVSQNYYTAFTWFKKAGDKGYAYAQNYVGLMYDYGRGVSEDNAAAVQWFRKAAEQDLDVAQYNTGYMYYSGNGTTRNYSTAMSWFRKAADQNYASAMNYIGLMYDMGRGVTENDATALSWYRKAADRGLAVAQYNTGYMYYNGYGTTKNYSTALSWFRKAADQNYAKAQNYVGLMYSNAYGVTENDTEAVRWYRKAALNNLAVAQFNLGYMYEKGNGVAKSTSSARHWYQKAADNGYANAKTRLKNLK